MEVTIHEASRMLRSRQLSSVELTEAYLERIRQVEPRVHALVSVTEEMQSLIHNGAGEHELEKLARSHSPGIRQNARDKVLAGETSLEEMLRVTKED